MKFIDIDQSISSEFPNTYNWLKQFENEVERDGCEIAIRDTDHRFDSLRIEVYSNESNYEIAHRYSDVIYNYVKSHCCKCGSSKGVTTLGDLTICTTVCEDCAEILKIRGIGIEGPEALLIPLIKQGRDVPQYKCRLKALDGHIFYKYSGDLKYVDGNYVLSENGSLENIILSGVYTGLRDKNGERIYTGDVVLAEDKDGRKFWGMIMYGNKWGKSDRDISPHWSGFCLVHGLDSFPSALCWAKRIEVIGNVVSSEKYVGPIPTDDDYERYYWENNQSTPEFST